MCRLSLLAYKFVFSNLNSILYIFHFESAWEALGKQRETEKHREREWDRERVHRVGERPYRECIEREYTHVRDRETETEREKRESERELRLTS